MDLEELKEVEASVEPIEADEEKKSFKKDSGRFEFALLVNDFLICRRTFQINGYVDGSMQTLEFKNEIDKIVEIIDDDLKSKSRVWAWYHHWPDHPEVEPEMTTDPLIEPGECVFKFVIYDNGAEVISKIWDGRYYPSYVRKNVDLTNKLVKITKDERVMTYDKDTFFETHGNLLSGELYVLKAMISDKENLIPKIQKCIFEVCSSFDGFYEKASDYHTIVDYKNSFVKKDENGNPIMMTETKEIDGGESVEVLDGLGNPWITPVFEKSPIKGKKYNFNISQENKKLYSAWGSSVSEKTKKYLKELYVSPKEKYFVKKQVEE